MDLNQYLDRMNTKTIIIWILGLELYILADFEGLLIFAHILVRSPARIFGEGIRGGVRISRTFTPCRRCDLVKIVAGEG